MKVILLLTWITKLDKQQTLSVAYTHSTHRYICTQVGGYAYISFTCICTHLFYVGQKEKCGIIF